MKKSRIFTNWLLSAANSSVYLQRVQVMVVNFLFWMLNSLVTKIFANVGFFQKILHLQPKQKDGALAQLARALDWQSKGQGFDSLTLHREKKAVQVEQPFLLDDILYFCSDKKRIITALITQKLFFMINWKEHIISDKNILLGKPTIKGTRISIEYLIGLFAQGWSEKQILENYPTLTDKDLFAVFAYVRECLQDGLMYELPKSA